MTDFRKIIIPLLCMVLMLVGCGSSERGTNSAVSGSAVSGTAVSGGAVSGTAVEESPYEITPEMENTLHWLASHQEKWCDEANTPDKYTDITYTVSDLDHNGNPEIDQFINTEFVAYTEVVPDGDSYKLNDEGKYNLEEYAMGIRCEEDGMTDKFKRDENPEAETPDEIGPRTQVAFAIAGLVTPDIFTQEPASYEGDKHITSMRTERIFFGSGLELTITKKIKEDVMYEALKDSLTAFYEGEALTKQICDDLMQLYRSDDYETAVNNHEYILVTDDDGDGHPTMTLKTPPDKNSRYYKKDDMLAVEAVAGDPSCVGLSFMRFNIWKVYLEDMDKISKKASVFGKTMEGNKYLNHYFPKMME